jgi:predicted RNA-binding Zn-ribbon protein involved in translation (DUF1610 family)
MTQTKTENAILDEIWIKRSYEHGTKFQLHLPQELYSDPKTHNALMEYADLKKLQKVLDHQLSWACPKCGKELNNYRRSELDWDKKVCPDCGWEES